MISEKGPQLQRAICLKYFWLQSAKEEEEEEEKAEDKKADEDKNEEDVAEPTVEAAVEASQPAPAQGTTYFNKK